MSRGHAYCRGPLKRVLDVVISAVAMLVLLPVFLMIFQGSLLVGFLRASSKSIDVTDADLWIAGRGVESFEFAAPLPERFYDIAVGVEDHPVAGVPVALVRIEIGQGRFPVGERSGATVARSQALPSPTSGRPEVEAGYLAAAPRLSRLISVCETAPHV